MILEKILFELLLNSSTVFLIRLTPSKDNHFLTLFAKTNLWPTTFEVFKARHSSPFSNTSGSVGKHKVKTVSTQFSHKSICWLAPLKRKSGKQNFEHNLHSVYEDNKCVLHPHWARILSFPFCLSINLLTSTSWLAFELLGGGVVVVIVLPSLWN